jgi:hypothetical protein
MEVTHLSKTPVDFEQTTRRCTPDDRTLHSHRCDNLKSYEISQTRSCNLKLIEHLLPARSTDIFNCQEKAFTSVLFLISDAECAFWAVTLSECGIYYWRFGGIFCIHGRRFWRRKRCARSKTSATFLTLCNNQRTESTYEIRHSHQVVHYQADKSWYTLP